MRKKGTHHTMFVGLSFLLLSCIGRNTEIPTDKPQQTVNNDVVSYVADPKTQDIALYWKNDAGRRYGSIQRLKEEVEGKQRKLLFAANGGMFKPDHSPVGLFIQNGKTITPLDTGSAGGNFYLKPNGVFYLTKANEGVVCTTEKFTDDGQIKYATQSGPMLLVDGKIHPAFKQGSTNRQIRNGVGILPNGHVLFTMSKTETNFYDFALYFKNAGCTQALYLDGFVSRTYQPQQNSLQTDGDFGVIIAVTGNL